jgi:xanthine dehydrogenase accessory factor
VSIIYNLIYDSQRKNIPVALCTIVSVKGSTPRKVGAKMLVFEDGSISGTIGGGNLEKKVIENALNVLIGREAKLFKHDLLHQLDMCCGGTVEIFIEPILERNRLYIFGAGHTGHKLAQYAVNLDFEIFLIDDRKEHLDGCRIPGVSKMHMNFQESLPLLPFDENVFACIMTYSHPMDREILSYCINKPFAYLGMIGSQRKVEVTKKMFAEGLGITKSQLDKVDMPMGLDIMAEGPDEIAISILAKLIDVKHKKKL